MKRFLLLWMLIPVFSAAQLKSSLVCNVYVDVLAGTVNGVEPDFTQAQVKKGLPCFTSEEPESIEAPCKGLIQYRDNDIYFYTGRDYVEIRQNYKGTLSLPLMGSTRGSLFSSLGNPKVKDVNWDAFQTQYGTLILHYNNAGRVHMIQFSSRSTDALTLCE